MYRYRKAIFCSLFIQSICPILAQIEGNGMQTLYWYGMQTYIKIIQVKASLTEQRSTCLVLFIFLFYNDDVD